MVHQISWWRVLTRRKVLTGDAVEGESKLNRVLGLYDLTALGVGSTLGAGVYVLAGQIARDQAGPSVMLSFAIAAVASLLAGICYAEFGARVPKAGSAYVYSYVCIGEFAAFVIGWNLMLEYMIGTAAVCRGISLYLDTMVDDALKTAFAGVAPMHSILLSSYFDFLAFGLVVVFGVALAFGVETSTMANNFCTCLNLLILLFVIIAGSIKANFSNWTVDVTTVQPPPVDPASLGSGGYFPFGFAGTLKGAATCFFGFVGFDCIATTGEEVRNPRKNIPRSILLSLFVIFLCYFGVSTVLTLMVPYYQQDPNAPLPYAFKAVGWTTAMWIVSVGGLVGLFASLFGALFPLPRIMYSMAEDGLLFRFLGKVSPRFRVPVVGSIFAAVLTAVIAGLFDLAQLVNLLSIGTLLAYSVVAISVTILRYTDNSDESDRENGVPQTLTENSMLTSAGTRITCRSVLKQLFNFKRCQTPNTLSTQIVGALLTLFCFLSLGIGLIFMQAYDALINNQLWVLLLLGVLLVFTAFVLLAICLQPRELYSQIFRVPFVPIVPAISIFINIYLMLQLDPMTWVRFGIWMAIGIPIFVACWCMYDIKNPEKRNPQRVEFERLLKNHSTKPANGKCSPAVANNLQNGASNSNTIEPMPAKNLDDEIMNMNDVSDDLIEMKHPNGKVFYIDESKSNRSTASTGSLTDERRTVAVTGAVAIAESTDDEKSVIAMLDDVLQAEDDGGSPQTPGNMPEYYSRKTSIDSEMLPSVIETTTVATVHSSSSSSGDSEKETDSQELNVELYNEVKTLAEQLVDEIVSSDELQFAMEQRSSQSEAMKTSIEPPSIALIHRSNSIDSMLSTNSVEHPMHSEKFKNKLSLLMLRPAPVPQQQQQQQQTSKPHKEEDIRPPVRPVLKQSKSEADVRGAMLKAIRATRTDIDFDGDEPVDDADMRATVGHSQARATDGIPKPPKFDPVLYKTINSFSSIKVRPKLDKVLKPLTPVPPKESAEPPQPEVPFKMKLEAILKRGPSHRTQKRPSVEKRRPKSMAAPQATINDDAQMRTDEPHVVRKARSVTKSESNINATSDPAEAINHVRKALRPVQNGVIKM